MVTAVIFPTKYRIDYKARIRITEDKRGGGGRNSDVSVTINEAGSDLQFTIDISRKERATLEQHGTVFTL